MWARRRQPALPHRGGRPASNASGISFRSRRVLEAKLPVSNLSCRLYPEFSVLPVLHNLWWSYGSVIKNGSECKVLCPWWGEPVLHYPVVISPVTMHSEVAHPSWFLATAESILWSNTSPLIQYYVLSYSTTSSLLIPHQWFRYIDTSCL